MRLPVALNWLRPPQYADPTMTRRATTIWGLLWSLLLLSLPILAVITPGGTSFRSLMMGNVIMATTPAPAHAAQSDVRATPLAKRTAEDMGVDLSKIPATGIGHRVREKDVIDFLQSKAPTASSVAAPAASAPATSSSSRGTTREPMSQIRKRIAARLVEAQHTAAMLTTFNEVDMSAVMALRTQFKEEFEKKHGIGLGFMSFFVKPLSRR